MNKIIEKSLLIIPLLCYLFILFNLMFSAAIPSFGFETSGLNGFVYAVFLSKAIIITFIVGSIYTFFKKLWWWFGAYMLLAGIPLLIWFATKWIGQVMYDNSSREPIIIESQTVNRLEVVNKCIGDNLKAVTEEYTKYASNDVPSFDSSNTAGYFYSIYVSYIKRDVNLDCLDSIDLDEMNAKLNYPKVSFLANEDVFSYEIGYFHIEENNKNLSVKHQLWYRLPKEISDYYGEKFTYISPITSDWTYVICEEISFSDDDKRCVESGQYQ